MILGFDAVTVLLVVFLLLVATVFGFLVLVFLVDAFAAVAVIPKLYHLISPVHMGFPETPLRGFSARGTRSKSDVPAALPELPHTGAYGM